MCLYLRFICLCVDLCINALFRIRNDLYTYQCSENIINLNDNNNPNINNNNNNLIDLAARLELTCRDLAARSPLERDMLAPERSFLWIAIPLLGSLGW